MPLERLREIYGSWAVADYRLVLAVIDNASGALVGEVVPNEWDEENQSCNFRTFIGATGRGRGLGTEATRLIVEHGLGRWACTASRLRSTPSTRPPGTSTRRSASSTRALAARPCGSTTAGSTSTGCPSWPPTPAEALRFGGIAPSPGCLLVKTAASDAAARHRAPQPWLHPADYGDDLLA